MDYLSFKFIGFLIAFLFIYYITPGKYRYITISLCSCVFYSFFNTVMLLVLLGIALISYVGGHLIYKRKSKLVYYITFMIEIMILIIFKYINFFVDSLNFTLNKININLEFNSNLQLVVPIGLSFIIFQTCAYLSDVYKESVTPETNFIRYLAYVSFFPTILSGPIQKARNLLPQIRTPKDFDFEQAKKGTILFIWGAFEKIMVANNLHIIISRILDNYYEYSSVEILIAVCCFSIYIYADFSAYSDIARGVSKLMNIEIGKNFKNPYLAQTPSEFWNRWHISLNEWFIENVYIPLGGNRKGRVRKYINIMIVFLISGLWHGAQWHFLLWGCVNGIIVVTGRILVELRADCPKTCLI